MTDFFIVLICLSVAGILTVTVRRFVRFGKPANLAIRLAALAVFGFFLYRVFDRLETPIPMGDEDGQIYFVIVLYLFMLMGMLASYGHTRFSKPKEVLN